MKTLAILVPLLLISIVPLVHATTLPLCTDESIAGSNGVYVASSHGVSIWTEHNDVPGLQTHDCVDANGQFHHADVEAAATNGHKQVICLTGNFCFWAPA